MAAPLFGSHSVRSSAAIAWAPTPTAHDPNPPITLESEMPLRSGDWPNPSPRPGILVSIDTRPDDFTSADAPFTGLVDRPVLPRNHRVVHLAFALNLLGTTLAQPTVPVAGRALDLPVVTRPTAPLVGVPNLLTTTLAVTDAPVVGRVLDLPAPGRCLALTWLESRKPYHVDETPAHQIDWPLPGRQAPHTLTWLQTRPVHASDEVPSHQTDWPLPRPTPPPALTWVQSRPVFAVDEPTAFAASWPNPAPRPAMAQTWIVEHLLRTTIASLIPPPSAGDWPLPLLPRTLALSWIQTRQAFHVDEATAFVPVWPLPDRVRASALTWTVNLLLTTLATPVGPMPFSQTDWPAPPRRQALLVTIESRPDDSTSSDTPFRSRLDEIPRRGVVRPTHEPPNLLISTLGVVAAAPLTPTDWPLPRRVVVPALSWLQTRPAYYVDATPSHQADWQVPLRKAPQTLTWIQTRPGFASDEIPAHQTDWPLPLRVAPQTLTWLQSRPVHAVDESPRFATSWPSPAPRPPIGQTWTVNLLQSTLAPIWPIRQIEYPNPPRAVVPALTWIQTRQAYYVDEPTRFVPAWPNPSPRPAPAQTWTVDHLLRTTIASLIPPPSSGDWPLPLRKTVQALSWTQSRPQYYVDAPIRFTPDWSMPRRGAPQTLTWTVNLLATTLAAPAPTPVVTIAWPTPTRAILGGLTWLQSRPAYYTDEPTRFSPDWSLPQRRTETPITWTQNLQQTTLAQGVPFAQTDWPLPKTGPRPAQTSPAPNLLTTVLSQATPVVPIEWTNPRRAAVTTPTWIQTRPSYYEDALTAFTPDWSIPSRARIVDGTWTVNLLEIPGLAQGPIAIEVVNGAIDTPTVTAAAIDSPIVAASAIDSPQVTDPALDIPAATIDGAAIDSPVVTNPSIQF